MSPLSSIRDVLDRHDLPAVLDTINHEVRERFGEGEVADYIPMLGAVPIDRFGMALVTLDGQVHHAGDALEPFSVQSVSKVHTLTLALEAAGAELFDRVGREPSGVAFNSLVQLEFEQGIPRNPLINAGALVVADVILSHYGQPREALLEFMRARSGNPRVDIDPEVFASEKETGYRNAALVNFLRSFGNIHNEIDAVLDFYYAQCSLRMDCVDLARSMLYLADEGFCPVSDAQVTRVDRAKRINAVMLTCGTYDAAGDFAFHVGLPAKSGVGGGIVAVVPKVMSLCVWSPGLDTKGNSLLGGYALHRFTEITGLSIF